jgi:hypothetical protein
VVGFSDIKDFLFYLNWQTEATILRTRFLVDQSFFTKPIIGISPTIKNSPLNPKITAGFSYIANLLGMIQYPEFSLYISLGFAHLRPP